MKCKICKREIPKSVGECVRCSEGVMEMYEISGEIKNETNMDRVS